MLRTFLIASTLLINAFQGISQDRGIALVEEECLQAVQAEPEDFSANYNIALYYHNLGVDLLNESAPNQNSEAEIEATNREVAGLFLKALPYAVKASELDPQNEKNNQMLKGINFFIGKFGKK